MTDDLRHWANYSPEPSPAEVERTVKIVGDPARAEELLRFGLRPLSHLDLEPTAQPHSNFDQPFEVKAEHLSAEDILVDTSTGYRFRHLPEHGGLVFDMRASHDYFDAQELLMLAANRAPEFDFDVCTQRTYLDLVGVRAMKYPCPLSFNVSTREELGGVMEKLDTLFRKTCGARRLWLRGQQKEYDLPRAAELCEALYGTPRQASLLPSAGRFAINNPGKMNLGLAVAGPNHYWKKPFLIWLMRENDTWFEHDRRALDVLSKVLCDEEDERFGKVLRAMQYNSELAGLEENVAWPEEADDLRQWFFAHMKPHSFGITLQQYGYITTLLDLTEDLDVALYFSQAAMVGKSMRKESPAPGRLIYVFAERRTGDFFRHGKKLFWGDDDWVRRQPPRLERQKAGFLMGSTCRSQNFYNNMVVARIHIEGDAVVTSLADEDLFPSTEDDLLYRTLRESRPPLEGLY
jgi:hypothetical protein